MKITIGIRTLMIGWMVLYLLAMIGCSHADPDLIEESLAVCVPGGTQACACTGGVLGYQVCLSTQKHWSSCYCEDGLVSPSDPQGSTSGFGLTPGGARDINYFRQLVMNGHVPEASDMTMEGFVAEHSFTLPAGDPEIPISLHGMVGMFADAQGDEETILALGMNSALDLSDIRRPLNLIVVLDVSGSMSGDKIAYSRAGLQLLAERLNPEDIFGLVVFNTKASVVWGPSAVNSPKGLINTIAGVNVSGGTYLDAGVELGYEMDLLNYSSDRENRVIIVSDGFPNGGSTSLDHFQSLASEHYKNYGIVVSTISVGGYEGDADNPFLTAIAEQGGGNAYYISNTEEMTEIFVTELSFNLVQVASELEIKIHLPDGVEVLELFGFDFLTDAEGWIHLLEQKKEPPQPDGDGPFPPIDEPGGDDNEPPTNIPALHASSNNGVIAMRLGGPKAISELAEMTMAEINYSYIFTPTGEKLEHIREIVLPELKPGADGAVFYYTDITARKVFVVVSTGNLILEACQLYHSNQETEAVQLLEDAIDYIELESGLLMDDDLDEDLYLLLTLHNNMIPQ